MNTEFTSLSDMIDMLSEGSALQISIKDIAYNFYIKEFELPLKYKMHFRSFCDVAKSTPNGYDLCMRCKALANRKAVSSKSLYYGMCPFGLMDIVKPVVVYGEVICIIYIGNIVTDKTLALSRLNRAASLTGVDASMLANELERAEYTDNLDKHIHIAELLDSYIRLLYEKSVSSGRKTNQSHCSLKLKEIIEYVSYNYTKNITLKQLSALYFMNEKYLGRIFKKQTGYSLHEFINKVRLQKAKQMLENTGKSVLEISLDCGYNNVTYFNRCFFRKYNKTPTQYREQPITNQA